MLTKDDLKEIEDLIDRKIDKKLQEFAILIEKVIDNKIEKLAFMIARGFDDIHNRMATKEDIRELQNRIDKLEYKFAQM